MHIEGVLSQEGVSLTCMWKHANAAIRKAAGSGGISQVLEQGCVFVEVVLGKTKASVVDSEDRGVHVGEVLEVLFRGHQGVVGSSVVVVELAEAH